ncbi:MAG: ATP-binding protein, partial [Bacteroidota bacterium]
LSLKPFESPFKIMLIWLPEFMHPSASNGILKILEEPPPNTFFILVTNGADKLLPTILSRVQIVQVPLLSDAELDQYLADHTELDEEKRSKILQLADGNLNLALRLIDSEEDNNQDRFTDWMRSCFRREYAKLLAFSEEFHEADKMMQRNFLQYSLNMLRETLLHRSGATAINRTKGNELKFIQDFSKVMSIEKIDRSSQLIGEASYFLERNGSAKMIFMDLSLQISKVLNPQ